MLPATTLSNNPPEAIFWVYDSFFEHLLLAHSVKGICKCSAAWYYTACGQEIYTTPKRGIEQDIEGVESSIFTSVTKEGDVHPDLESGKIPQRF